MDWERHKFYEKSLVKLKDLLLSEELMIFFDKKSLNYLPKGFFQLKQMPIPSEIEEQQLSFKISDIVVIGSFLLRTIALPHPNIDIGIFFPNVIYNFIVFDFFILHLLNILDLESLPVLT